jgi:hypothetical protein
LFELLLLSDDFDSEEVELEEVELEEVELEEVELEEAESDDELSLLEELSLDLVVGAEPDP